MTASSFKEYVDQNEAIVQLLQLRMQKRVTNHAMSELEAWQYVTWGMTELLSMLCEVPAVAAMAAKFQSVIAVVNAGKWEAQYTGKFPPPHKDEMHFSSPEEMERFRDGWRDEMQRMAGKSGPAVSSETSYSGGTYL